jgi:hypothetical protein
MMDRNNGFAPNWWGTLCRGLRDFANAFDVNPLALVSFLVVNTMIMAWFHAIFDWFRVPEWWYGPTGVLFLIVTAILVKHTWGYTINSKYNSPAGVPPVLPPGAPDPGGSKAGS